MGNDRAIQLMLYVPLAFCFPFQASCQDWNESLPMDHFFVNPRIANSFRAKISGEIISGMSNSGS